MSKLVSRREGFHLACELGFKFINLDIDSGLVINWLMSYGVMKPNMNSLIFLLQDPLEPRIIHPHHIFRNANGVADELAKRGTEQ